jgi:hypothetical protein
MPQGNVRPSSFNELPELGQGEIARLETSAPGVDLEALADAFSMGGHKPMDNPIFGGQRPQAVQPQEQPQPQPVATAPAPAPQQPPAAQAPVQPDTPVAAPAWGVAPPSPGVLTPEEMQQRVNTVLQKYGGDPQATARAYVEVTRKATELGQNNAALVGALGPLYQEITNLRDMVARVTAPVPPAAVGGYPAPVRPPSDPNMPGAESASADEFLRDPRGNVAQVVREVFRTEMATFTQAQRQAEAERKATDDYYAVYNQNRAEAEALRPVMDQIYAQNATAFQRIPPAERLTMLIQMARDRVDGWNGRQAIQEVQGIFSANGGAATAPPGTSGALPSGMPARGVPGAQAPRPGDLSRTPAMQRLWRAPGNSLEEDRAVMDVFRERGHFANLAPRY